jgi:hypothetical protein
MIGGKFLIKSLGPEEPYVSRPFSNGDGNGIFKFYK